MNTKRFLFFCSFYAFFLVVLFFEVFFQDTHTDKLRVSFLDVGQGDAILIETPNQKQVLIDAGNEGSILSPLKKVMPRNDKTIDMIVITNPDSDHMGGFLDILKNYTVTTAVFPGTKATSATYKKLKKELTNLGVTQVIAYTGMQFVLDEDKEIVLDILFPDQIIKTWEKNDGSIVSRLVYGDTSVLLTGDATTKTEDIILSRFKDIPQSVQSNILKIGHHGSQTSTSQNWLDSVTPDIAVISVGEGNTYGHPHTDVLERLMEQGVHIYQTNLEGTISFFSDGISWQDSLQ